MKLSSIHCGIIESVGYQPDGLLDLLGGDAPGEVCADYFREYGGELEDLIKTIYQIRTDLVNNLARIETTTSQQRRQLVRLERGTVSGNFNAFRHAAKTLRSTNNLNTARRAINNSVRKIRSAIDYNVDDMFNSIIDELIRTDSIPFDKIGINGPEIVHGPWGPTSNVYSFIENNRNALNAWLQQSGNEDWTYIYNVAAVYNRAAYLLQRVADDILPVVYTPDYKSPIPRPK